MRISLTVLLLWGLLTGPLQAQPRIEAVALMSGAAMLVINGRQQFLREGGSSPEGVRLVRADARQAVIEWGGEHRTLSLSSQISTVFEAPEVRELVIPRNAQRQYLTRVEINGRDTLALVDTGANSLAMSAAEAARLGLDWEQGRPVRVATASGEVTGRALRLRDLRVDGIRVPDVEATVIEGEHPPMVLLGISVLQHFDFREESGVLYLRLR